MPGNDRTFNRRARHDAMPYATVLPAWCFLNVFINLNYPAPLPSPIFLVLPSLEVWGVLLLVSIFIVESYGLTLYDTPRHAERFLPLAKAFDAAMERAGLKSYTSVMQFPTFGGTSWLAFGTLESGVWLPDQLHYT